MSYTVEVDWAPGYELLTSLGACVGKEQKMLELEPGWAKGALQRLEDTLPPEVGSLHDLCYMEWVDLLVWLCPRKDDVPGLLGWLEGSTVGDLYERLAPYMADGKTLFPPDLGAFRDRALRLLTGWYDAYFRHVDPAILRGLAADAAARCALRDRLPAAELVELATSGMQLAPAPGISTVLLVPQHHYRPWNLHSRFGPLRMILYPADVVAPAPGALPPGLLRLTRALADENRLRILRFLAGGTHSFTEVVHHIGLAKSTVNYHMVLLRAAGLVRVHDTADGTMTTYSLRPSAVSTLGERLHDWLGTRDEGQGTRDEGQGHVHSRLRTQG